MFGASLGGKAKPYLKQEQSEDIYRETRVHNLFLVEWPTGFCSGTNFLPDTFLPTEELSNFMMGLTELLQDFLHIWGQISGPITGCPKKPDMT